MQTGIAALAGSTLSPPVAVIVKMTLLMVRGGWYTGKSLLSLYNDVSPAPTDEVQRISGISEGCHFSNR